MKSLIKYFVILVGFLLVSTFIWLLFLRNIITLVYFMKILLVLTVLILFYLLLAILFIGFMVSVYSDYYYEPYSDYNKPITFSHRKETFHKKKVNFIIHRNYSSFKLLLIIEETIKNNLIRNETLNKFAKELLEKNMKLVMKYTMEQQDSETKLIPLYRIIISLNKTHLHTYPHLTKLINEYNEKHNLPEKL